MISSRSLLPSLLGVLLLSAAQPAAADSKSSDAKVDRAVHDSLQLGASTQSVIISVKPGYREVLRQALRQHGDVIKSEHPLIDAVAVELHSGDVYELANQPWVESVAADSFVYAKADQTNSEFESIQNVEQSGSSTTTLRNTLRATLGLPSVAGPGTPTGVTGIGVAIVDSGISPSDNFAGRITGFYDFTKNGQPTAPFDDYGHGTHIAGLIGSSGKLSNYEYQGIAPGVRLVGFKVLDHNGRGKTSDVIKAIEYIAANKDKLNVHIVNLSLGHPIYAPAKYDPLVQAVEKASAAGLIVVTSAGNFGAKQTTGDPGYTGITSPCNSPSAICVGSAMTKDTITRDDDVVAPYSSRGPAWFDGYAKPDVVAPGHNLASDTNVSSYLYNLLKANHTQAKNGLPMLKLSGTSMAAGVTSGVVAVMLQAHNQSLVGKQHKPLTPNLAKALLEYSAIPLAGADYLTQGAGEINARGAMELAATIDTDKRLGSWWLGIGNSGASHIGTQVYPWSRHVIWGDAVLTGNLVYVNNIVWGTGIVWGSVAGANIVWGTSVSVGAANIVWGTANVWATNIVWADRVIGQQDALGNILWGTISGQNIVWGTLDGQNIVWGTVVGQNIVWGTWDAQNIVWGTTYRGYNVVLGTNRDGEAILWKGSNDIVWGTTNGGLLSEPQGL